MKNPLLLVCDALLQKHIEAFILFLHMCKKRKVEKSGLDQHLFQEMGKYI